jgi:phage shock protein C
MNMRGRRFEVDRENKKVLGVCAGIANRTGIDPTIVRVGVVVLALLISVKAFIVLYLVGALVGWRRGSPDSTRSSSSGYRPSFATARGEESRDRMRNMDLRMQAIETYVTSSNSRLAREIEDLR